MVRLSNIHTFENGQLKQVLVDGGYIPMDDWSGTYRFYVKDHLGNNRMVVHQSGTIEQVNNYYPYGGLMSNSTGWNTQRFKYNGKEMDRMYGLDTYDHGARQYNPARITWDRMDPLAEKYYNVSPYVYCAGNPIRYVDPDGREAYMLFYVTGNGKQEDDSMFKASAETRKRDVAVPVSMVKKELARVRATAMEGPFGTHKEHYGLKRINGRIKKTEILIIFFGVHTANAVQLAKRIAEAELSQAA